ncbi:hypothetical protein PIB30_041421 [Stylosanthes scabra]|uniref:Uncharacterized protein n=1 Tax=Stylosanthes scabra TaxID=79078 RepID=A0ABU6VD82_9FABA|nr:hypothetical protein [Stylosanthes scabra]
MSLFKNVHQGLSKQVMEEIYLFDQGYTPLNPPPYQHHAPPPPYPPSQGNFEDILQVLLQERKALWKNQSNFNNSSITSQPLNSDPPLDHYQILGEALVEEESEAREAEDVDQEVEDNDREPKEMEIVHSASSEATPSKLPSELQYEWVNFPNLNFIGPKHYALLETDDQLGALDWVLDKKETDSLELNESRFITCGKSEFKFYSGHIHKLLMKPVSMVHFTALID